MAKRPGINWGRSRLSDYESIYSIYAKFSVLNGLSPSAGIQFVSEYIDMPADSAFLTTEKQARKLAKLLDEPLGVVNTSVLASGFYNDWSPRLSRPEARHVSANHIFYCVSCVRQGFHGIFHLYGSIPICPIHKNALSDRNDAHIGSGTDIIVANLVSVCSFFNPDWPAPPNVTRGILRKKLDLEAYSSFLDCSHRARLALDKFNGGSLWRAVGEGPERVNIWSEKMLTELLMIRSTFSHAPESVNRLLADIPEITYLEEVFQLRVDEELTSVIQQVFESGLIHLYRKWWSWTGSTEVGRSEVASVVSRVLGSHEECPCVWHLHGSKGGWTRREIPWYHRQSYQCPYQFVANFVTKKWGSFESSIPRSERAETTQAYNQLAAEMAVAGFVSYDRAEEHSDDFDGRNHTKFEWKLPESVLLLLAKCVLTEFNMDIAKCLAWLNAVDGGEDPGICQSTPHCAAAVLTSDEIKIIQWNVASS